MVRAQSHTRLLRMIFLRCRGGTDGHSVDVELDDETYRVYPVAGRESARGPVLPEAVIACWNIVGGSARSSAANRPTRKACYWTSPGWPICSAANPRWPARSSAIFARLGLSIRLAVADTIGAAWAAASMEGGKRRPAIPSSLTSPFRLPPFLIIPPGESPAFLRPCPSQPFACPRKPCGCWANWGLFRSASSKHCRGKSFCRDSDLCCGIAWIRPSGGWTSRCRLALLRPGSRPIGRPSIRSHGGKPSRQRWSISWARRPPCWPIAAAGPCNWNAGCNVCRAIGGETNGAAIGRAVSAHGRRGAPVPVGPAPVGAAADPFARDRRSRSGHAHGRRWSRGNRHGCLIYKKGHSVPFSNWPRWWNGSAAGWDAVPSWACGCGPRHNRNCPGITIRSWNEGRCRRPRKAAAPAELPPRPLRLLPRPIALAVTQLCGASVSPTRQPRRPHHR